MTIRTKDGEEVVMSYKDISEGKFMIRDGEGNVMEAGALDLSKVPAWVPRVPGVTVATGSFRRSGDGKSAGMYVGGTSASADAVEEFFKGEAGQLGFTSSSSSSSGVNGTEVRSLDYSGGGRGLKIVITSKPGSDVQVNVGYEEK